MKANEMYELIYKGKTIKQWKSRLNYVARKHGVASVNLPATIVAMDYNTTWDETSIYDTLVKMGVIYKPVEYK